MTSRDSRILVYHETRWKQEGIKKGWHTWVQKTWQKKLLCNEQSGKIQSASHYGNLFSTRQLSWSQRPQASNSSYIGNNTAVVLTLGGSVPLVFVLDKFSSIMREKDWPAFKLKIKTKYWFYKQLGKLLFTLFSSAKFTHIKQHPLADYLKKPKQTEFWCGFCCNFSAICGAYITLLV